MRKLDVASAALLIIGGLNWGLVAIANFDLVAAIFGLDFGQTNVATRIIYGLVGLAATPPPPGSQGGHGGQGAAPPAGVAKAVFAACDASRRRLKTADDPGPH